VLLVGDLALPSAPDAVLLARVRHPATPPPSRIAAEPIEEPIEQPFWRSRGVRLAAVALVLLVLALVVLRPGRLARGPARVSEPVMLPDSVVRDSPLGPRPAPVVVANPADAAAAAKYSVEILAANTAEGANFELQRHGAMMPAATISLVPIGATDAIWYKVHSGALADRAQAERLLASLRRRGVLSGSTGAVVRTPFALRVDSLPAQAGMARMTQAKVQGYVARGLAVYALIQRDGSARLYAGAFENPEQSSLAATALRVAGVTPVLEYRTGRVQ
jgi:hypothetical protein